MEYNIILGTVVFLLVMTVGNLYAKTSNAQKDRKLIDNHMDKRIGYLRDEMRFRFENPPKYNVGQVVVFDNKEYIVESCIIRVGDAWETHWLYTLKGQNDKTIEIRE